jgi:hypothetical protein
MAIICPQENFDEWREGLCFYVFEDLKPNDELVLDSLHLGIRQRKAVVVWSKSVKEDLWKAGVKLFSA